MEITVGVLIFICYLNLRGLKEAGLPFVVATYSFVVMVTLTIVTDVARHMFWGLPTYDPQHMAGTVPVQQGNCLVMGATILVILRAFANGGSHQTAPNLPVDGRRRRQRAGPHYLPARPWWCRHPGRPSAADHREGVPKREQRSHVDGRPRIPSRRVTER